GLSDFSDETVRAAADFLAGRGDLPASFSGILFIDFDQPHGARNPRALCWDRNDTLMAVFGGSADSYMATATVTPAERSATAQQLDSAEIEPTTVVMMGSCDLRGPDCLAPGSAGSVFAFFHRDEQFLSCQRCREGFGWPAPRLR